jgi:hypothetical protein
MTTPQDSDTLERLGAHVDRYQAIIARMAESSLKVKALTATAVGVLVPIAVERSRTGLLAIALLLVAGLALLDAYYLSLERGLRTVSDTMVRDVTSGSTDLAALYTIDVPSSAGRELGRSLIAPATLMFYLLIVALLALGWILI